ncbi:MAG: hypothetical protein AAF492_13380, partial [Verrucomicrobiota bacterium]
PLVHVCIGKKTLHIPLLTDWNGPRGCPLQTWLVGDPLARPWARPPAFTCQAPSAGPVNGKATFRMQTDAERVRIYLDGEPQPPPAHPRAYTIDTTRLSDGYHELLCVAEKGKPVVQQTTVVTRFKVNNHVPDRTVRIGNLADGRKFDFFHNIAVRVIASGEPESIHYLCQGRIMEHKVGANEHYFILQPEEVGRGPVRLQPAARYKDGKVVHGRPIHILIENRNQAPQVALSPVRNGVVTATVRDPENDLFHLEWGQSLFRSGKEARPHSSRAGKLDFQTSRYLFTPSSSAAWTFCLAKDPLKKVTTMAARVIVESKRTGLHTKKLGLVFNYDGPDDFMFFGLNGSRSAWNLVQVRNGRETVLEQRGAPLDTATWYDLMIRNEGGRFRASVNGHVIVERQMQATSWSGRFGLGAGAHPFFFEPPSIYPARPGMMKPDEPGTTLTLLKPSRLEHDVVLMANDGHAFSRVKAKTPPARRSRLLF